MQSIGPDILKSSSTLNNVTQKQSIRIEKPKSPIALNGTRSAQFAFVARMAKSDTSSDQSSEEQDTSQNYSPRYNSNSFRVPLAPERERLAASFRIQKALDKVSNKVSTNRTRERTSCDFYVGNLEFKADADDLIESIHLLMKKGTGIRLVTATKGRESRIRVHQIFLG